MAKNGNDRPQIAIAKRIGKRGFEHSEGHGFMVVISNSTPLIYLSKMGELNLLKSEKNRHDSANLDGLSKRPDKRAARSYMVDDSGSGFDLVFLSAIIHSNSVEENRKLMRKCAQALNSHGQVVVQDFIMDEDRTSPAHGALFALNMLVGTEAGDTYTESEVRRWMEEAGLSNLIRKDTHFGTTLIIGRKGK